MKTTLRRVAMLAGSMLMTVWLALGNASPASAGASSADRIIPLTADTPDYACGTEFWTLNYYLKWQCDGNLVLYSTQDGSARWATGTYGWPQVTNPTTKLNFSRYGYMSLRDHNNSIVCAFGGPQSAGGYVSVQNDGNLVVYTSGGTPVWASGTYNWQQGTVHACW